MRDHFLIAVPFLGRGIGVEHALQRSVNVKRHDRRFQNEDCQDVNASQNEKQGQPGSGGGLRVGFLGSNQVLPWGRRLVQNGQFLACASATCFSNSGIIEK